MTTCRWPERLPAQVRTTHPAGFRCGEWADVLAVANVRGRPCWSVRFPDDGATDQWVIHDDLAGYEYRTPPVVDLVVLGKALKPDER